MKVNNIAISLLNRNNKVKTNPLRNNQISFARSWEEHQSWGVRVDGQYPTVKLFSFPDAKKVSIEINGDTPNKKVFELDKKPDGIFEKTLQKGDIKAGDKYQFIIEDKNGNIEKVKDPYSFMQPTLLGPSVAYNQGAYKWGDFDWQAKNNPNRISRLASANNSYLNINQARIYELHVPTLTKKGNFEAAKGELKRIKDLGFNAIEIMPVENTYSFNWGYDGVDKFSPATYMGGADKLKDLINEAHKTGLNVIMDMVPNHIGVDGSQFKKTGPYNGGNTPWGDAFNYEGENSRYVRDFIVNAALNWLHNYHCDGLRLDMTKFMNSDTTMQQIAAEVNYHFPNAFLIAEDARNNVSVRGDDYWHDWWQPHDERVTIPLKPHEFGMGENEQVHNQRIDDIQNGKVTLARLGYDSEWDFHYYHTLSKIAYGEVDLDALERAIFDSSNRVKYSASHDEIGNMDGTRPIAKYMVPLLKLNENVYLDDNDIQRAHDYVEMKGSGFPFETALDIVKSQKVQQVSMKLAQLVQQDKITENMSNSNSYFNKNVLPELCISSTSFITPKKVVSAFKDATSIYKAIETLRYFTPGPVMTFQGEENIQMTKFNFFRQFDSIKDESYLYTEKGYPYGLKAYQESILGNIDYGADGIDRMNMFEKLTHDLNKLKSEAPALISGKILLQDTVKHNQNPTIALHSRDEKTGSEAFIISNFSNLDYPVYEIEFPCGEWREAINTNNKKYGGTNTCQNTKTVFGYGDKYGQKIKTKIALPAKSSLIFIKK